VPEDLAPSLASKDSMYLNVALQALKYVTNKENFVNGEKIVTIIIQTLQKLEIDSDDIPSYSELVQVAKNVFPNAMVWKKE
jgi:hypothetical protein